ncbi:MAG TPA: type II secretion system F family protein [Geminicoccaceae bacterium]|nr:type II secretion system F family protein [Geminicoccaceae bacterium]
MLYTIGDLLGVGDQTQLLMLVAVFGSVLLIVLGAAAVLAPRDAAERRLEGGRGRAMAAGPSLRAGDGPARPGLQGFLTPADAQERSRVRRLLFQAGYRGPHALRNYYLVRTVAGLALPAPLISVMVLAPLLGLGGAAHLPPILDLQLSSALLLTAFLVAVGFYGPILWVRHQVTARQQALREGFPNALDLMQVAIEAGLGFDAALARIAEELAFAHPVLAEEFLLVGVELRAGKARDQVLNDLAGRAGVEEIGSFVAVINQSMRFGTSIADALEVYAAEMRHKRMMSAEEKANKLPVKMSGALVMFMLPAVLTVCLGPVIIRAIRLLFPTVGG